MSGKGPRIFTGTIILSSSNKPWLSVTPSPRQASSTSKQITAYSLSTLLSGPRLNCTGPMSSSLLACMAGGRCGLGLPSF